MKLTETVPASADMQTLALLGCAASERFAATVGSRLAPVVWEDDWARILAQWACEYAYHYRLPALEVIDEIAKDKSSLIPDEDTAEGVRRYASRLKEMAKAHETELRNQDWLGDRVLSWARERMLRQLAARLETALEGGNVKDAEQAVLGYTEVQKVQRSDVNILQDADKIAQAYADEDLELFHLRGALGSMCGPVCRGDFFLVMGESGTGKSWMCLEMARQAVLAGLSVLYVNLENTEKRMTQRAWSALSGRASKECEIEIPYFDRSGDRAAYARRTVLARGVDAERSAIKNSQRLIRMATNGGSLRILSFPSDTMKVVDIESEMQKLYEYERWLPDMLIVDYGSLLRAENTRQDKRLQVDEIYLGLRRIALSRKIAVVSPVQSNRQGYGKDPKTSNMGENIGNVFHASVILGLSHSPQEKEAGIINVSMLKNRDNKEFATQVVCLGCLDIGRLVLDSEWADKCAIPAGMASIGRKRRRREESEEDDSDSDE